MFESTNAGAQANMAMAARLEGECRCGSSHRSNRQAGRDEGSPRGQHGFSGVRDLDHFHLRVPLLLVRCLVAAVVCRPIRHPGVASAVKYRPCGRLPIPITMRGSVAGKIAEVGALVLAATS